MSDRMTISKCLREISKAQNTIAYGEGFRDGVKFMIRDLQIDSEWQTGSGAKYLPSLRRAVRKHLKEVQP